MLLPLLLLGPLQLRPAAGVVARAGEAPRTTSYT